MAFGDFTVTRASTKNILGSAGLYVSVANNVPAFEFNTDGSYRGLLVEPGATNLILQSQAFNEAVWAKTAGGTGSIAVVTANDAVAPDGTTTADKVVLNRGAGNTGSDLSQIAQSVTVVNATVYTGGFFIKASEAGQVGKQVGFRHVASSAYQVITLTADWVRIAKTETSGGTSRTFDIISRGGETADNSVSFHIWQAQLELGSVATSPIVTTAGTASRVADVVTLTGASSLINQTAGTFYAEVSITNLISKHIFALDSGSVANIVTIFRNGAGAFLLQIRKDSGTVTTIVTSSALTANGIYKVAVRYESGNHALYINGTQIGTSADSANFPSSLSRMIISDSTYGWTRDHARSFAVFPVGLTDSQLASLTTL
jgi:hypothetical protein